jgi:hypothetical protein
MFTGAEQVPGQDQRGEQHQCIFWKTCHIGMRVQPPADAYALSEGRLCDINRPDDLAAMSSTSLSLAASST